MPCRVSRSLRRRALLVAGIAALPSLPNRLAAQVSPDLVGHGRVEWAVEKLVGFGLIDDRVVGIRPWSHREAQRLLEQARRNLTRLTGGDRRAAESVLGATPEAWLGRPALLEARAGFTALDRPWASVPDDTGANGIDAEVNPLVRYRGGRSFVDGQTLGIELGADVGAGEHVALHARPRLWIGREAGGAADPAGELLAARVRVQSRGLRLDVGRSASVWGQGRSGGSLLADDARGLDRVRLSSDTPFRWPGPLSFLGPTQAELFIARLDGDRDIPHSTLVGYTLSARPHPLVEASFSALIQSGGEGGPDASVGERIADHLLLVDWIFYRDSVLVSSNKGTSLSLRVRIPSLRHAQLYAEHTIEDPARNLVRLFWQDAAWLVGAWVPRLNRAGTLDLRVELHHGGPRLHRHGQFTSGRTLDGLMLGMGGPDTDAGLAQLAVDRGALRLLLELGAERRSADRWRPRIRENGGLDVWRKVEDRPDERSLRASTTLALFGRDGREVRFGLGLEHVWNAFFEAGQRRLHGIAEVHGALTVGFGG